MKESLKIAITGGIGSGKSTVIDILSKLGFKVVSLDEVYAKLLDDQDFVMQLCNQFDIQPVLSENKIMLDRKALSEKVFSNAQLLAKLNAFTHQKIFESAFKMQENSVTFYEVPLLFEGDYQHKFDRVWVVMRDKNARIASAVARDGNEQRVLSKVKNQVDYDKLDLSLHTIIKNDGDIQSLQNEVKRAVSEIEQI